MTPRLFFRSFFLPSLSIYHFRMLFSVPVIPLPFIQHNYECVSSVFFAWIPCFTIVHFNGDVYFDYNSFYLFCSLECLEKPRTIHYVLVKLNRKITQRCFFSVQCSHAFSVKFPLKIVLSPKTKKKPKISTRSTQIWFE